MGNLQSTSSSNNTDIKYDVFISFRGEDTRGGFTSHLYEALCRKKIETFIDNQLIRGDVISSSLSRAIEESKISVVIFSKDYASSKWCLRELVEIMKYVSENNQICIPVFYGVDPFNVRKQTGSFKDSFDKHEQESLERMQRLEELQRLKEVQTLEDVQTLEQVRTLVEQVQTLEEVQTWREALTKASNKSGWHSSVERTDAALVLNIVDDIWKKLMDQYTSPAGFGGLIGLERINQIISLLCLHDRKNVLIIGILGMGGVGKTTLADAIFNNNSNYFQGVCFIQNVRERLQNSRGLAALQKEILSKVLHEEKLELDGPTIPPKIKERLNRTRVFIVLDDVDDFLRIEPLFKGVDGLGKGSRILITTRNRHVLQNCRVNDDNIYEVEGFNPHEALQLFHSYAFKDSHPTEDFKELSKKFVDYAKGNPLALKVLGSSLYQKRKQEWESAVNILLTNLDRGIYDVFKISFDGLDYREKNIFLDIACFLKEEKREYVAKILDDCDYSLSVLIGKSLITISRDDSIQMHDLLQEMGWKIVQDESPDELVKRSRLWRQEDVLDTLKRDDHAPKLKWLLLAHCTCLTKIPDLSKSPLIEKIDIRYCRSLLDFPPQAKHVNNLRDLFMQGCKSLRSFPSDIHFESLESLDLRGFKNITKFPGISGNITHLDLSGTAIDEVPPSIQCLTKLRKLNLSHCTRLQHIPTSIRKLKSFYELNLVNCLGLESFPEILDTLCLSSLVYLDLSENHFEHLPKSMKQFCDLKYLNLNNCKMLQSLTELPSSLQYLSACDCEQLRSVPGASEFAEIIRNKYFSEFIFTNCLSFEAAVGNMFAQLRKCLNKVN